MAGYRIERQMEIAAPPERVWETVADVKAWPGYKPFITRVRLNGDEIGPGSKFTMTIAVKGPAVPIPVKVCRFNPPHYIAWTGGIPGLVKSVHGFDFQDAGGMTVLVSWEKFTGPLVWLMRLLVGESTLFSLHDKWLECVKARVEAGPSGHA